MATVSKEQFSIVKELYYEKGYSMQAIADELSVTLNAVVYFMRHHGLKRRSSSETNALVYERKPPSFQKRDDLTSAEIRLEIAGVMLYWAEGYKAGKRCSVDFANSDPLMVEVFLAFLRTSFVLDETKLIASMYCYSDQDIEELTAFWSSITHIPSSRFRKPYIRTDFRENGRKMKYGLVHIKYYDKKLLREILNLIQSYAGSFRVGGRAVKYSGL